ncbi:unnamed protein product [Cylicocyclus nassatus]|uniref:Uncharacterized protein n=1 Tax=Cylicocyclus nassatus TaxID=53992 RepID=A0AA36DM77_CYLNA|nr:unnamed protein product [Cylicocyclus nassatus]
MAKKYALVNRAPSDGFKFELANAKLARFLQRLRAEIIKAKKYGGSGRFGCAVVSKYGHALAVCYVPQDNRC